MTCKPTYEALLKKVSALEKENLAYRIKAGPLNGEETIHDNERPAISTGKDSSGNGDAKKEILSILRAAPIGIGVVIDRVIIQANKKLEKITGYTRSELIGQNAVTLYPSRKEYERVGIERNSQIRQSGTGTIETRWVKKDGDIIEVLLNSAPIDSSDHSKGVTFTALDITSAKNNERALLESEEKYRTMMEAQEDPTYICSSDYRLSYMNPAMLKWIGRDCVGEKCYEALWNEPRACPWCSHKEVLLGEKVAYELKSPLSEQTYHVVSAPVYHADGAISNLTSYRDVSEIKQLNIRLQQSQKMETIGTLAGGIAHDFNNILFPILGYAEILKTEIPPDDISTHEGLDQIHASAIRAKDLVSQILTFARQEQTEYRPLKVQLILKEVIKLLRATIPREIEIAKYVSPDCRPILADATQIHQVIMNLATNAYQAMGDSGGVLTLRLEEVEVPGKDAPFDDINPGRYARLLIADTGLGMTAEVQSKIFEPFFTTKKKDTGTGMGLSVVHGIVNNMNGHIRVQSRPGHGTELAVFFPIDSGHRIAGIEKIRTQALPGGNETILLVDDEPAIIQLQTKALEKLGYKVITETDPERALSLFEKEPEKFDLIITDLSMPKLSGDKLAGELLRIRPGIPIVLCTGFSEKLPTKKPERIGVNAILMKPVTMKKMAFTIREVLACPPNSGE